MLPAFRIVADPAGGEPQYGCAGAVDPRHVVGDHQQRCSATSPPSGEYGRRGDQRVRRRSGRETEDPVEGVAMVVGDPVGVMA
ncbi:hypothetical protein OG762_07090 [Streptomyces sp. NBC_01136]|uniref:hypothetical protein n=1 Tax=Streptomyces sp. NBC_01136 TaxID=2903754 RepID=UPI003865775B|nr:hypothetical protein OG762_07090 [Streptomyces sp. NBC_01136]